LILILFNLETRIFIGNKNRTTARAVQSKIADLRIRGKDRKKSDISLIYIELGKKFLRILMRILKCETSFFYFKWSLFINQIYAVLFDHLLPFLEIKLSRHCRISVISERKTATSEFHRLL